jgi:hypothetical protein
MSNAELAFATAAAQANAVKAFGGIVTVEPALFSQLVNKSDESLVVAAESRIFGRQRYRYLTGFKGLVFFTKSHEPLQFSSRVEILRAKKIQVPWG